ncbi:MAG: cell wall hydrolase, partial [Pseudomonadota bacterium]
LTAPLSEQMRCLAGAVYFESRGEPLAGQLAVANVVINRADDRRFPASYCGVVYQRAQFSFVKRGRMPRIRTQSAAWRRAKAIAHIAHDGLWESEAADAVYFHATYVRPKWSRRKTRLTEIDTHIFYR